MRHFFLLIALIFTGFMCGQKSETTVKQSNPRTNGTLTVANGGHGGTSPSPVAESLDIKRQEFQQLAAQCRSTLLNRNGSPEVVQPLNPTNEILSKTNHPPQ